LTDCPKIFKSRDIYRYHSGRIYKENLPFDDFNRIENVNSNNRELFVWTNRIKSFNFIEFQKILNETHKGKPVNVTYNSGIINVEIDEKNFIRIAQIKNIPKEITKYLDDFKFYPNLAGRLKNVRVRYSICVSLGAGKDLLILQRLCAYFIARLTNGVIDDFDSFFEPAEYFLRFDDITESDYLFSIDNNHWIDIAEIQKLEVTFSGDTILVLNHFFSEFFPNEKIRTTHDLSQIRYISDTNFMVLKRIGKDYRVESLAVLGDKNGKFYSFIIKSFLSAKQALFIYYIITSESFSLFKRVLSTSEDKFNENRKEFHNITYLPKVRSIFLSLSEKNPTKAYFKFILGELSLSKNPEEAYEYYQEALILDPNCYIVYIALGNCCKSLNRLDEAKEYFLLALGFEDIPFDKREYIEDFLKSDKK